MAAVVVGGGTVSEVEPVVGILAVDDVDAGTACFDDADGAPVVSALAPIAVPTTSTSPAAAIAPRRCARWSTRRNVPRRPATYDGVSGACCWCG